MALKIFVDTSGRTLVDSFRSQRLGAILPNFVQGDQLAVQLHFLAASGRTDRPFDYVDNSSKTVKLALGRGTTIAALTTDFTPSEAGEIGIIELSSTTFRIKPTLTAIDGTFELVFTGSPTVRTGAMSYAISATDLANTLIALGFDDTTVVKGATYWDVTIPAGYDDYTITGDVSGLIFENYLSGVLNLNTEEVETLLGTSQRVSDCVLEIQVSDVEVETVQRSNVVLTNGLIDESPAAPAELEDYYTAAEVDTQLGNKQDQSDALDEIAAVNSGDILQLIAGSWVGRTFAQLKTSLAIAWGDISGKPDSFTPSAHKTSHATGGADALTAADIGAIAASEKGAANGVAELDEDGKVPAEQLPEGMGGGLSAIDDNTILANTSGGSAVPVGTALTIIRRILGIPGTVLAAHTSNVAALTGYQTVGGMVFDATAEATYGSANFTVLLTGQTDAKENGPWVVGAGAWTRPAWFANASAVLNGLRILVAGPGSTNRWREYVINHAAGATRTVGTDNLTFTAVTTKLEDLSGMSAIVSDIISATTADEVVAALELALADISDAGSAAALDSDTDTTLAANSDLKLATQKAVKAYVDTKADTKADLRRSIVTESTTARTIGLTDENKYIRTTNGSATTITVPANATTAFPVGTEIDFFQAGAGQVSFSSAGGVTINSKSGHLKITGQYSGAVLKKVATNEWDLVGDLSA